jgi:hypothetical protein
VATQIAKLKERFGLDHVVLVGDRGMITQARIEGGDRPAGLDGITALRAPAHQALAIGIWVSKVVGDAYPCRQEVRG